MDAHSAETALRRARKRLAHSIRMEAEAETPRAKARHDRRKRSAQRRLGEAVWTYEQLTLEQA
jgi:hypothetical protein